MKKYFKTFFMTALMAIASSAVMLGQDSSSAPSSSDSGLLYSRGATYMEHTFPAAPEAASVTKYSSIPVNNNLGHVQLEVPCYTLQGKELSIPVSLQYYTGGIKLDEIAGVAGLGWTLNAGGCITRTVIGIPDEITSGMYYHQMPDTLQLENTTALGTLEQLYLKQLVQGQREASLDRYDYNVCGLSGSFIINDDGNLVQLSGDGVKILYHHSGEGAIDRFDIVGADGTTYVMSAREVCHYEGSEVMQFESTQGREDKWDATTAWYVTSIISRSGLESAHFSYSHNEHVWVAKHCSNKIRYTCGLDRSNLSSAFVPLSTYTQRTHELCILQSITLNGQTVSFSYDGNTGNTFHSSSPWYGIANYPVMLKGIRVARTCDDRELLKIAVNTQRDNHDGRIMLQSLNYSCNNQPIDAWGFGYYTMQREVKRCEQDPFGYFYGNMDERPSIPVVGVYGDDNYENEYNTGGQGNSSGGNPSNIIPFVVDKVNITINAKSFPATDGAKYMSLRNVVHNGAKTEYRYDNNIFDGVSVGIRVRDIATYDKESLEHVRHFEYSNPVATGPVHHNVGQYSTITGSHRTIPGSGNDGFSYDYNDFQNECSGDNSGLDARGEYVLWTVTVHDAPVGDGPSLSETRIMYGQVSETVSPGHDINPDECFPKTVKYYSTEHLAPYGYYTIGRFPSLWQSYYASPFTGNTLAPHNFNPMDGVCGSYRVRGSAGASHLIRQEDYAVENGEHVLKSSASYRYNEYRTEEHLIDYRATRVMARVNTSDLQPSDIYHYPVYACSNTGNNPTSVTNVSYYPDGRKDSTVVVTSYLTRDANLEFPSRVSQTSVTEGGKTRRLELKYADSLDENYAHTLTNQHFIGTPLVKSYFIEDAPIPDLRPGTREDIDDLTSDNGIHDIGNSFQESIQVFPYKKEVIEFANFATSSNRLLPSAHVEYVNGNLAWREDVLSRDHAGNIQQGKETGKPNTVILWSYNGKYPVAVIENASLEEVRANLNLPHNTAGGFWPVDPVEELTHLQQPSEAQIAAVDSLRTLLPDAQVSTYTFNPGIGISSATDANGVRTSFEYDFAGRLSAVRDADGNLVKDYEYNLLDDDGDGLLSILSRVYRSADASQATTDKSWWNTLGLKQEDIAISASGNGEDDLVTLYISDYLLHDDVRTYLPTPLYTNNGRFISIGNAANRLYGSTAPYVFKNYEVSNRDKVTAVALPGYIGSHESTESDGAATSFPKHTWTATGITGGTSTYNNWEIVKTVSSDADGRVKTVFKDHVGRILGTSFGNDAPTYYIYDDKDQLCAVASSGIAMTDTLCMWRYSYDHLGRLSSKGIPGCVRESYEYDNEDHIIAVHRNGVTKQMEYDAFGRMVRAYLSDTNHNHVLLEEHEFDKGLEVQSTVAQINADGIIDGYAVISHEYDAKSRPICNVVEYPDGGVLTETLTYNFPGEVVSSTFTYSKDGQTDTFTATSAYDVRGRMINGTSTLALGNSTPVSVSTQYHFDEFGRPSGSTTTSGGIVRSSTDTYTLQGWMSNHSVALNGNPLFAEALGYDSGSNPSYTGLITSKQESRNGVADNHHDEYQYDYAGRLSREETIGTNKMPGASFEYDTRGNILQVQEIGGGMMRTWSYLYSGDMLSSETISTRRPIQTNVFAHDNLGRMTSDGHSGTRMEYNHMDLLTKVASGDSILVNYSYLADGTKTSSLKASGEGLVYRGPFTYRRSADGTLALESVACPEGRLTPEKALLYVTDHLGSVRAVIDGNTAEVLEASQYSAYGTRSGDTTTYRDHFTGQEDQMPDFGIPYSDHGARQYSPALRRWMTPDPLSEKYYGLSPYNYCACNPVSVVDLDGRDAKVYVDDNKIVVSSVIFIYGKKASKKLAADIQYQISSYWNDAVSVKLSGKKVSFDVSVVYAGKKKPKFQFDGVSNYMEIDNKNRSYVKGYNKGRFNKTSAAHEFGHLMGLADQYTKEYTSDGREVSKPNPGWEGSMMGEPSGYGFVFPEEIEKIIQLSVPDINKNGTYYINASTSEKQSKKR